MVDGQEEPRLGVAEPEAVLDERQQNVERADDPVRRAMAERQHQDRPLPPHARNRR